MHVACYSEGGKCLSIQEHAHFNKGWTVCLILIFAICHFPSQPFPHTAHSKNANDQTLHPCVCLPFVSMNVVVFFLFQFSQNNCLNSILTNFYFCSSSSANSYSKRKRRPSSIKIQETSTGRRRSFIIHPLFTYHSLPPSSITREFIRGQRPSVAPGGYANPSI